MRTIRVVEPEPPALASDGPSACRKYRPSLGSHAERRLTPCASIRLCRAHGASSSVTAVISRETATGAPGTTEAR
jgi:hypothetical protein